MARALELLFVLLLVVAVLVTAYRFTGRRLEVRRNDPLKGMNRKDRSAVLRQQRELELRERKLRLEEAELRHQERLQQFINAPSFPTPGSDNSTVDPKKEELP